MVFTLSFLYLLVLSSGPKALKEAFSPWAFPAVGPVSLALTRHPGPVGTGARCLARPALVLASDRGRQPEGSLLGLAL